jgi:ADP-ribose pyrophosphatase YjhB (NUDIX family)
MTAVVAIINYNGKILIGKKKSDSQKFLKGKWHIPGERVEEGESDQQALIRGMKAETGLDIKVGKYLCSSITPTSKTKARWYECFANTDNVTAGEDLEELKWIRKGNVLLECDKEAVLIFPKKIIHYFYH